MNGTQLSLGLRQEQQEPEEIRKLKEKLRDERNTTQPARVFRLLRAYGTLNTIELVEHCLSLSPKISHGDRKLRYLYTWGVVEKFKREGSKILIWRERML